MECGSVQGSSVSSRLEELRDDGGDFRVREADCPDTAWGLTYTSRRILCREIASPSARAWCSLSSRASTCRGGLA